ncbi:MAG: GNAT family N-acetyltransferase [Planctomycetes bacterium]|nr:GNAT family N-acetyltransferase [Planctomycetota bacterium]
MPSPIRSALQHARFRRQAAPARFAIAEHVDWLNPTHWDGLTDGRGFLFCRGYHRALAAVLPPNVSPRYAIVYRGDEPVAAMAMQLVEVQGARLRKSPPAAGLRGLPARLADRMQQRVLVIGNLLSYGNHGVAVRAGCEGDDDVWHGVGEAAYRVRRAEKHTGSADFVLMKDLDRDLLTQSALLQKLGFRPVETEPNMVLTLQQQWRGHDDYLGALTKKYRKNLQSRVLAPVEAAGLELCAIDDVAAAAPRLQELYLAVHENAALRPVTLGADYWPALARAAGDRARFAGIRRGGDLLGFIVTLRDDEHTALGYHIGFDREVSTELPLYLRLLQRTVEDAIGLGARRLSLGRTALEPKAALGARPEPMHVWVRHRQGVLNKLLRGLLGRLHHDEAPERSPFGKQ